MGLLRIPIHRTPLQLDSLVIFAYHHVDVNTARQMAIDFSRENTSCFIYVCYCQNKCSFNSLRVNRVFYYPSERANYRDPTVATSSEGTGQRRRPIPRTRARTQSEEGEDGGLLQPSGPVAVRSNERTCRRSSAHRRASARASLPESAVAVEPIPPGRAASSGPSQPCCIISVDQRWRHRHRQQKQLFGVGHFGWIVTKWSRGRPFFPRRHFSISNSHRESTPPAVSDLPQRRGAQNGSTLNNVADPMSAGLFSGCYQHSGWPHRTSHPQPDGAAAVALPGTRQRRSSWTKNAADVLAKSDWKVPRDHGR